MPTSQYDKIIIIFFLKATLLFMQLYPALPMKSVSVSLTSIYDAIATFPYIKNNVTKKCTAITPTNDN